VIATSYHYNYHYYFMLFLAFSMHFFVVMTNVLTKVTT